MTSAQRSYCMSRIRNKDTLPELQLRRALWGLGFRYRLRTHLPGRPDIVFRRERIAIFVDGCFWHKCPIHYRDPTTNASTWESKIARNIERDRTVNQQLATDGWLVLRFWEHQVIKNPSTIASKIAKKVENARRRFVKSQRRGTG